VAWYADGAPCDYYGKPSAQGPKAVGWLEKGHEYARGDVSEALVAKLVELLVDPWEPAIAAGLHRCDLCRFRFSNQNPGFTFRGTSVALWTNCVFVPDKDALYVAPSGILHYLDAHEYAPPGEFVAAVLACPPMGSMNYLRALKKVAPPDLLKLR
jgi:hypothetical protein